MARTKIECRPDGLTITKDNKENLINGDFRVKKLGSGAVKVNYGENYATPLVVNVSDTRYSNTQELLDAINCGGSNSGGDGSGNTSTRFTQQITDQTTTTIVVTANGGTLPADDSKVILSSLTGPVFQGNGSGEYTINRAATPNEIELNNAPPIATNYLLDFSIEQ